MQEEPAEKEETAAEKEKKRAEQIEFYTRIAKRVKKQCPKCGSIIAGALGYHEPNAKCHDCGCEWNG